MKVKRHNEGILLGDLNTRQKGDRGKTKRKKHKKTGTSKASKRTGSCNLKKEKKKKEESRPSTRRIELGERKSFYHGTGKKKGDKGKGIGGKN